MPSIKKSFTANVVGKIWTTLMSFAFLPYYIKLIGFEAYGLVGVYSTLLALSNIFDFGLGSSMTREMARLSSQPSPPERFSQSYTNFRSDLLGRWDVDCGMRFFCRSLYQ